MVPDIRRVPIQLMIQKNRQTDKLGKFFRYRTVERMILTGRSINSEAQLCYYVYRRHGKGRYMVTAWQKGYPWFWKFWLGDLYSNGFIRDVNKNKELDRLKGELARADTYEEREYIEEDMEFEREISEESKRIKRVGPLGLRKCKPGILHAYEEI